MVGFKVYHKESPGAVCVNCGKAIRPGHQVICFKDYINGKSIEKEAHTVCVTGL